MSPNAAALCRGLVRGPAGRVTTRSVFVFLGRSRGPCADIRAPETPGGRDEQRPTAHEAHDLLRSAPRAREAYLEYVLGEFVPGLASEGLAMSDAWHTAYGQYPLRLTGFVAPDLASLEVPTSETFETWKPASGVCLQLPTQDRPRSPRVSVLTAHSAPSSQKPILVRSFTSCDILSFAPALLHRRLPTHNTSSPGRGIPFPRYATD